MPRKSSCVNRSAQSPSARHALDEEGVDVDEAGLQEVQGEGAQLLVVGLVARDLPALAVEDEIVDRVPVLHHVEPAVDLPAKGHRRQVVAEKRRLDGLAQLRQGLVGGVLGGRPGEASQDRLGLGGSDPQRRGELHHLVVLVGDELPVDGPGEDRLEVEVRARLSGPGAVELLGVDPLQPGQQLEAEEMAEGEGDLGLAVGVHVVALYSHVGAVSNQPLDHCRHLG